MSLVHAMATVMASGVSPAELRPLLLGTMQVDASARRADGAQRDARCGVSTHGRRIAQRHQPETKGALRRHRLHIHERVVCCCLFGC